MALIFSLWVAHFRRIHSLVFPGNHHHQSRRRGLYGEGSISKIVGSFPQGQSPLPGHGTAFLGPLPILLLGQGGNCREQKGTHGQVPIRTRSNILRVYPRHGPRMDKLRSKDGKGDPRGHA
jgi:hypothetical protein